MPPVEMSRSMFTPAYQEVVFLAAALLEAKHNPGGRLQIIDTDSASLRSDVPSLYAQGAETLIASHKDWRHDAEVALNLCIERVLRVCFNENWLAAGEMPGLQNREVKDIFADKLLELAGGKTRRGVLPPGLLDLYLACLPIIYSTDEAGAKSLRGKVARARERLKPMPLPRPRPAKARQAHPLLGWNRVAALLGGGLLVVWLVYFLGWHGAIVELRHGLPKLPAAAVPSAPSGEAAAPSGEAAAPPAPARSAH